MNLREAIEILARRKLFLEGRVKSKQKPERLSYDKAEVSALDVALVRLQKEQTEYEKRIAARRQQNQWIARANDD